MSDDFDHTREETLFSAAVKAQAAPASVGQWTRKNRDASLGNGKALAMFDIFSGHFLPCLLNRNDWKEVASPAANLLLKVGEAGKQFADVTALDRMLRHLFTAAWRQ